MWKFTKRLIMLVGQLVKFAVVFVCVIMAAILIQKSPELLAPQEPVAGQEMHPAIEVKYVEDEADESGEMSLESDTLLLDGHQQ